MQVLADMFRSFRYFLTKHNFSDEDMKDITVQFHCPSRKVADHLRAAINSEFSAYSELMVTRLLQEPPTILGLKYEIVDASRET